MQGLAQRMDDFATTLTNALRPTSDLIGTQPGIASTFEVYIQIVWPWMIVSIASIIFVVDLPCAENVRYQAAQDSRIEVIATGHLTQPRSRYQKAIRWHNFCGSYGKACWETKRAVGVRRYRMAHCEGRLNRARAIVLLGSSDIGMSLGIFCLHGQNALSK